MLGKTIARLQETIDVTDDVTTVITDDFDKDIEKPEDDKTPEELPNDTIVEPISYNDSFKTRYVETYKLHNDEVLQKVTIEFNEINKPTPRCPVYITRNQNGKRFITAYITGMITDIYDYVDLIDILNIMEEGDEIYQFIDSPGGYVATGAHIASCNDKCNGKVITCARGFCASAASLIWSSGHECQLTPFSLFMYHMSSHLDMGNSFGVMMRASDMVRYVRETLLKIPKEKGHITSEELEAICTKKDDKYIDAKTMYARIKGA